MASKAELEVIEGELIDPPSDARDYHGIPITKAQELEEPNSILLFGRAKIGKSTLAASISEVSGYERVLHIDLEQGSVAFAHRYPNVDVLQIPYGDVEMLTNVVNDLYYTELGGRYDAVIVDTMSTGQDWLISYLSGSPGLTVGESTRKLEFDGWAKVETWTMEMMWHLHHMAPLGITCYHLKDNQTALTKEVLTVPKIKGQSQFSVANVPDIVARLYVVDTNDGPARLVDMSPKESKSGGNRFENLPTGPLADVTLPLVWQYIRKVRSDVPEAPKTAAERFQGTEDD
jgi:hypothetical protein